MKKHVFILGSGFSKGIHQEFPLMGELASQLKNIAAPNGRSLQDFPHWNVLEKNFESGLLELKKETDDGNSDAKKLLETVELALAEFFLWNTSITGALSAWDSSSSDIIEVFLNYWVQNKCQVISLNYDLLIEQHLERLRLKSTNAGIQYPDQGSIYGYRFKAYGTQRPKQTVSEESPFQLLKLHGSANWLVDKLDFTQVPKRVEVPSSKENLKNLLSETPDDWHSVRKQGFPFIVPPFENKTQYYAHPVLKDLWQRAEKALGEAEFVTIIGYSLPDSDHAIHELLACIRRKAEIIFVDLSHTAISRFTNATNRPSLSVKYYNNLQKYSLCLAR